MRNKYKSIIIFFTLCLFVSSQANENNIREIQLMFDSIKESRNDSLKLKIHERLTIKIKELIEQPSSFEDEFQELPNLGKVYSDDHIVRFYTWSFPLEDKTFQYGGFIQYKTKAGTTTTQLIISEKSYLPTDNQKIDEKHWYGALYYKVIKIKKRKETYYIALGWAGNNAATDFKIIEPFNFNKAGHLQSMGKPIFKNTKKRVPFRYIMEYNSEGKVVLDYQTNSNLIIFDHLSPINPSYKDIRSYYGPDFTYDAFRIKKGDLYFEENIDARNRR